MKKILIIAVLSTLGLISLNSASAQVRVGISINVGEQPRWRAPGHDYVEYYYLPDIETYYYVPERQFIYLSNGRWVFSSSLPYRYRDYDLYSGTKVVINRHNAYDFFNDHKRQYPGKHFDGYRNGWYKRGHRRH